LAKRPPLSLDGRLAEMEAIIDKTARDLVITQDLGLGMMLWMTHFFPEEWWAELQRRRSLAVLDRMWIEDGYFAREPYLPEIRFAFTNYGVSVGLQAVGAMPNRVERLNAYFERYRSGDDYDRARPRSGGKGVLAQAAYAAFSSCGERRHPSESRGSRGSGTKI
jgi:hypothetical protein